MGLASLILVNLLLSSQSTYLRIFSHPLAAWLGRLSYSLYLWQQLFTIGQYNSWARLRVFPINLIVSFVLASISYYFIEKPFLNLKERIGHATR